LCCLLFQGRRKSLSTGNLKCEIEVHGEEESFEGEIFEDELEVAGSVMSRSNTNDQNSDENSDAVIDDVSLCSERPRAQHRIIRYFH
jgi:hypothetical protein